MLRGMGGTKLTWTISQGRYQGRMYPWKNCNRFWYGPFSILTDQDSKSGGQLPVSLDMNVWGHLKEMNLWHPGSLQCRMLLSCDSQLISHSVRKFPPNFQKVCPRTAVSFETIHEKCLIGGLRGGLCSDNDLLKNVYFGSLGCQFVHRSST